MIMNKTHWNVVLYVLFALFIYKAVKWYSRKTDLISMKFISSKIRLLKLNARKSKSTLRTGPLNCYNSELVTMMNVKHMTTCRKKNQVFIV